MATDHRGRPIGDNHLTTIRVQTAPNRFVRPVADSQGRPYPPMQSTGNETYPHWYADRAADEMFNEYERNEGRIEGTQKPIKNTNLLMSIDRVGPYYAPTVHNPHQNVRFQGTVGAWTKWGARRIGRRISEAATSMPMASYGTPGSAPGSERKYTDLDGLL